MCIPFGLCTGPWLFTKITKPIINYLRSLEWVSVVYLDDWWLTAETKERCNENVAVTRKILESLGFVINVDKSDLFPSTTCQFLGFILDSSAMTLELTRKKRKHILELVKKFKTINTCLIRDFACFVGNIIAVCPAVNYGWFHSKLFERQRYLSLLHSHDNYDANM
ncbi:GSCOCG00012208001-RA-CDS [Cotesia congregata]|nr:GSCOCG00012208001-RA-CDS [Cotesia congregata]